MPTRGSVTALVLPVDTRLASPEGGAAPPQVRGLQRALAAAMKGAMAQGPDLLAVIDSLGPVVLPHPAVAGGSHLAQEGALSPRLFPVEGMVSGRVRRSLAGRGIETCDVRSGAGRTYSPVAPVVASILSFLTADAPHLPVVAITLPDAACAFDGTLAAVGHALRGACRDRRLVVLAFLGGPLVAADAKERPDAAIVGAVRQSLFGRRTPVASDVTTVAWAGNHYICALVRRQEQNRSGKAPTSTPA